MFQIGRDDGIFQICFQMAMCSIYWTYEQYLCLLELHRIPLGINHDGLQEMTYITEGKDQNDIVVR